MINDIEAVTDSPTKVKLGKGNDRLTVNLYETLRTQYQSYYTLLLYNVTYAGVIIHCC